MERFLKQYLFFFFFPDSGICLAIQLDKARNRGIVQSGNKKQKKEVTTFKAFRTELWIVFVNNIQRVKVQDGGRDINYGRCHIGLFPFKDA